MAEKDRSTIPAVSVQPLNVEEIIQQVRTIERACLEALAYEEVRLESLRTACAALWDVNHGN